MKQAVLQVLIMFESVPGTNQYWAMWIKLLAQGISERLLDEG